MDTLNDYPPEREEEAADLSIYVVYSFESPRPAERLLGMSPGEQPFVRLERETCDVDWQAFVRESGEKECTEVDSREERSGRAG